MKKIVIMAMAVLLVVTSALCFASCGQKTVEIVREVPTTVEVEVEKIVEVPVEVEVEKIVEVPVEVEKIVEVPVEVEVEVEKIVEVTKEVPTYVEVEKTTTEINGIAVTGDYATQTKTDTITLTVLYVDKTLNPDFDPTLEEGEDNPLYIADNVVATFDYAVECTYQALIFGGATYLPTLPEEEILVRIEGFYAINGGYLYATDATHTITAAGHVDTDTIPDAAFEQAAADYEYVTFAVAD